jgi:hypothetical protein
MGTLQATYGGWPLYHSSVDRAPGDVHGRGADGAWWVLYAEGETQRREEDPPEPPEHDGDLGKGY